MANYTAADIKALREKTGAGMMDVKKALDESDGDQTKAMEALRIKGLKGATKREGRSTSDGLVATSVEGGVGTMIELNSDRLRGEVRTVRQALGRGPRTGRGEQGRFGRVAARR